MSVASPPAKRARASRTDAAASLDIPPTPITPADIARLDLPNSHQLIASLLKAYPINESLIRSHLLAAPTAKVTTSHLAPLPPRPVVTFPRMADKFETALDQLYQSASQRAYAAKSISDDLGNNIRFILSECGEDESDYYLSRRNAFSTLYDMAYVYAMSDTVVDYVEYRGMEKHIVKGFQDLLETMEKKGEVERLIKDGAGEKTDHLNEICRYPEGGQKTYGFMVERLGQAWGKGYVPYIGERW